MMPFKKIERSSVANAKEAEISSRENFADISLQERVNKNIQENLLLLAKQRDNYSELAKNAKTEDERKQAEEMFKNLQSFLDKNDSSKGLGMMDLLDLSFYTNTLDFIITTLGILGYGFTKELLNHAKYNKVYGSHYVGGYDDLVFNSSVVAGFANNAMSVGGGAFPSGDLHYALNNVIYKKFRETSTLIRMEIHDFYDFNQDDKLSFLVGVANGTMVIMQDLKIIVPYYIDKSEVMTGAVGEAPPWEQPIWFSSSNSAGTISVSDAYGADPAWEALNGTFGQDDNWSVYAKAGWLKIELYRYVRVVQIEFFNVMSAYGNRTKNFKITGTNGIALGDPNGYQAQNKDFAREVIDVGDVMTNRIVLNISSSYGTWVGCAGIVIHAMECVQPNPMGNVWRQPLWSDSNTNAYGSVSASATNQNEYPWKAFNGTMLGGANGNCDNWSAQATSGFLSLRLNSFIIVNSIEFYNGYSDYSNRTASGYFTGRNGVALGNAFVAPNCNYGFAEITVGGVLTNVIQLNITSSYGSYIDVSKIKINAMVPAQQPSLQTWNQPIWSGSNSNGHGSIYVSGAYPTDHPWRAFDGNMIGKQNGYDDNWSVESKTGWIQLTLNYPICVQSIEFNNNISAYSNRTKDAYFTADQGSWLGSSFRATNSNYSYNYIPVGGVWTSVIRLNITSSYGSWVGAGQIRINATC
jgi:hypothetical protein